MCLRLWGNTRTGKKAGAFFGDGFEGGVNLQFPTRIGSDGISVLDSVSRTYTPMENLIHTFGHEVGHSLGLDIGTQWHVEGDRMGMDAVDKFRALR